MNRQNTKSVGGFISSNKYHRAFFRCLRPALWRRVLNNVQLFCLTTNRARERQAHQDRYQQTENQSWRFHIGISFLDGLAADYKGQPSQWIAAHCQEDAND